MEVRGTPLPFERALARTLRGVLLAVATPITFGLFWFGQWWWLPVPLAAAIVSYELLYGPRRDRPTTLRLTDTAVELQDSHRQQSLVLPYPDIHVATLVVHRLPSGGTEALVLLADEHEPRLALRFWMSQPLSRQQGVVDLDALDAGLGGPGGTLPSVKAVAPFDRVARQRFDSPQGLEELLTRIPASAWTRAGARVWRGAAPPLDAFGYHLGEPDGWLLVEGERWRLRRPGQADRTGTAQEVGLGRGVRTAELVLAQGEAPVTVDVPLAALSFGEGTVLYFPADPEGETVETANPTPESWHTHFPEAAALVAHWGRIFPERWGRFSGPFPLGSRPTEG